MKYIMQDFKDIFTEKFVQQRFHYHLIGGIILGVIFWFLTIEAYYTWQRLILTNLIVFMGAVGWELVRGLLYKYKMDWADVRFGVYGSLIGSFLIAFI